METPELLIRVDERVEQHDKWMDAHMAHHSKLSWAFVSTAVSVILTQGGMIFALLRYMSSS